MFSQEDTNIDTYDYLFDMCREAFINERVFGATNRGRVDLVQVCEEVVQRMHDDRCITYEVLIDLINCMMAVHMEDI